MGPRLNQCHAEATSTKARCKKICGEGELFCCHHQGAIAEYPKGRQNCKFLKPRKVYRAKKGRYSKRLYRGFPDYRNNGAGGRPNQPPAMTFENRWRAAIGLPLIR